MDELTELRNLFESQSLAVLATQSEGGVYANLVAFAVSEDLKYIVFATARKTQKYRNVRANPAVAMLVDSRSNKVSDFIKTIAVTAIGRAAECVEKDWERLKQIYLRKHPNLASFAADEHTVLVKVAVERYVIAGFSKIHIIIPG